MQVRYLLLRDLDDIQINNFSMTIFGSLILYKHKTIFFLLHFRFNTINLKQQNICNFQFSCLPLRA